MRLSEGIGDCLDQISSSVPASNANGSKTLAESVIERNPEWVAKVNGLLQSLDRLGGAVTLKSTGATIERDGDRFRVTWPPWGRNRLAKSPGQALEWARGPAPAPPRPNVVPKGDGSMFGDVPF